MSACGALSTREIDARASAPVPMCRQADVLEEVDALAHNVLAAGVTPGLVVGAHSIRLGEVFRAYGVSDVETARPMRYDDRFQIGSLSKGLLVAIVNALEARNTIAPSDTLGSLITHADADAWSPAARNISVQQLLDHQSGLPRQPYRPVALWAFVNYLFDGSNFYGVYDRSFTDAYLAQFDGADAGVFNYSNLGFGLLGAAVEARTGRSLDSLLVEFVTRPDAMTATSFDAPAEQAEFSSARGHVGDQPFFVRRGTPMAMWRFSEVMRGAAAATSNAPDLLRFATIGRASTALQVAARQLDRSDVANGRGLAHIDGWTVDKVDGVVIAFQVGLVGGYSTYVGIDVARGNTTVVLQNSFNWADRIGHSLLLRMNVADALAGTCAPVPNADDRVHEWRRR